MIYCSSPWGRYVTYDGTGLSNILLNDIGVSDGWCNYLRFITSSGMFVGNFVLKYAYKQHNADNTVTGLFTKFTLLPDYEVIPYDNTQHISF
jgi:hypothetical protein